MAHFAKLNENNQVIDVNVVNNEDILDENGNESEEVGIAFLIEWSGGHVNWKQTSYNASMRKNFAGIGFKYDSDRDAFIPPKTYGSWTLNEETCRWEPPVAMPNDGAYRWDEDAYQADNTQGWVAVSN